MNCDNDFYVRFDKTFVKVKPFCESSNMHYKVYLQEQEVKLLKFIDEAGTTHWHETGKGESNLATELGKLIEEQQKELLP
ncbi:hypothetical protein [Segetibacter aerophilus]|uniref:Uncharacterized protein n=1 Tax=Segetibacter aerophilus TaxID=670293 RepID=A0A512B9G8_9BACT|nr:hypothetical protein [Segetibacter aerophilus]GEO08583.1 hypothetical protein SAE01_10790 [Segetibacter aerophilus]